MCWTRITINWHEYPTFCVTSSHPITMVSIMSKLSQNHCVFADLPSSQSFFLYRGHGTTFGGFLKWGYPPESSIFRGCSLKSHPFWIILGYHHGYGTPHLLRRSAGRHSGHSGLARVSGATACRSWNSSWSTRRCGLGPGYGCPELKLLDA